MIFVCAISVLNYILVLLNINDLLITVDATVISHIECHYLKDEWIICAACFKDRFNVIYVLNIRRKLRLQYITQNVTNSFSMDGPWW